MPERQLMRENQFRWTVVLDGVNCGAWMEVDGGDKDSEESKIRPAGGEAEESLGGSSSYDNLQLTAPYDALLHAELEPFLDAQVGRGKPLVATRQPLDRDGIAFGRQRVYRGTLKKMTPPKGNSDSSDASTIGIEVTVVSAT